MAHLYFDESIHDRGDFIVGALVISNQDISTTVRDIWRGMGFDPNIFEYKSSTPKQSNPESQQQRTIVAELLHSTSLAFTICPCADRRELGRYCASLVSQLQVTGLLPPEKHSLFVDQNIFIPKDEKNTLSASDVDVHLNQDSRIAAGLQVADHAAHALGGMLLGKH